MTIVSTWREKMLGQERSSDPDMAPPETSAEAQARGARHASARTPAGDSSYVPPSRSLLWAAPAASSVGQGRGNATLFAEPLRSVDMLSQSNGNRHSSSGSLSSDHANYKPGTSPQEPSSPSSPEEELKKKNAAADIGNRTRSLVRVRSP